MTTGNSNASLRVRISADLADIKQGLGLLRGELAKVKADAAKTVPDTTAWSKGIGRVRSELAGLVGAYVGVQSIVTGVQALFSALDRADRIGELAVQSTLSTEALSRLSYAAKFSGVDIEALNSSVVKFSRGLRDNEKLLKGIGVSTRDASGNWRDTEQVLLDVANVFASLPDGPERAELAIKLFGKSGADLIPLLVEGRAKLEEYGKQAQATGNVISAEAAQAAGEFNDNLDRLKGTLAGVANETVKNVLPAISGYAAGAADAGKTQDFAAEGGRALASVLKVVAAAAIIVKNVVEAATNVIAFLGSTAMEVSGTIGRTLGGALGNVAGAFKALSQGENPVKVLTAYWEQQKKVLADAIKLPSRLKAGYDSMKDGLSDAASDIGRVGALFDEAQGKAAAGNQKIADSAKAVKPASEAAMEALRKLLDGGGKGGDKSKAEDSIKKLRAEIEKLEKASADAAEAITKKLMERDQRITDGLDEANVALLDASGRTAEAKFLQIDQKWRQLLIDLKAAGDTAGIELVNKVINLEKLDAQLDEFKRRAGEITNNLRTGETSISAQSDAGMLGSVEAEEQIGDLREKSLQQLRDLRKAVADYYAQTKDPTVLAYLQELDGSIAEVKSSTEKFRQKIADIGKGSLNDFFDDLIDGSKSFSDAFRNMVAEFAAGVAKMIANELALRAVQGILSSFGGGGGATVGAAHGGGIAGSPRMFRHNINPMVFGAAPRYHGGGIAGLAPNEVPAILERGERIRTVEQERALQDQLRAGQGGGTRAPEHFILALTEDQVASAMAGKAGEKVTVLHARSNRGAIESD